MKALRGSGGWALAAALSLAVAAGAEVRQMEAVGAVPLQRDERSKTPPRDAAVRKALNDAVQRVALDLLPDLDPAESAQILPAVLGDEPFGYVTRFRILEDRGERPALFVDDPGVDVEYVVVVEVHVDSDRVQNRLAESGLLTVTDAEAEDRPVRLVVEDLTSYAAYESLRQTLIEGVGVKSTRPLEMERGRAVLEVVSDRDPRTLLDELLRAAPAELRIIPLELEDEALALRVELLATPEAVEFEPQSRRAPAPAPRD